MEVQVVFRTGAAGQYFREEIRFVDSNTRLRQTIGFKGDQLILSWPVHRNPHRMNLLEHLLQYDCHLMAEDTSHEELVALDSDLPSDVHLVRNDWSTIREEQAATFWSPC